jgi:hypothetical protein
MQVSRDTQHIHVRLLRLTYALAQAANPQGVLPVVTSLCSVKKLFRFFFYKISNIQLVYGFWFLVSC